MKEMLIIWDEIKDVDYLGSWGLTERDALTTSEYRSLAGGSIWPECTCEYYPQFSCKN